MSDVSRMASKDVYFRNTRSGKKGHRQPRTQDFKYTSSGHTAPDAPRSECGLRVLRRLLGSIVTEEPSTVLGLNEYVTLGSWSGGGCSCVCFMRIPELVTCMVSVRNCGVERVHSAVQRVCSENTGCNAPMVKEHNREHWMHGVLWRNSVIQISGKLAPSVVDVLQESGDTDVKCDVTFCNATRSTLGFSLTLPHGTHMRTMSPGAALMLSSCFPAWSACIEQPSAPYYKILCEPTATSDTTSGGNSCCMLYTSGRVRLQGTVDGCARTLAALAEALRTLMSSDSSKPFLCRLTSYPHEPAPPGKAETSPDSGKT